MDPFRLREEHYRENLKPHPENGIVDFKNPISVYFSLKYYLATEVNQNARNTVRLSCIFLKMLFMCRNIFLNLRSKTVPLGLLDTVKENS